MAMSSYQLLRPDASDVLVFSMSHTAFNPTENLSAYPSECIQTSYILPQPYLLDVFSHMYPECFQLNMLALAIPSPRSSSLT
jgi:hypothetical protein